MVKRVLVVLLSVGVAAGVLAACIPPPNPHGLPISHVVVLMQENRSADSYLGQLHAQGQPAYEAEPLTVGNPDPITPSNPPILPYHKTVYCDSSDLNHSWNGTHQEVNNGAMDGFTAANSSASDNADPADPTGRRTMGYYDQTDLPFYYSLYSTFSTNDRYFSSLQSQTFPNRLYLLAGTSFGHIRNDVLGATQKSIFELLDQGHVDWRIYGAQYPLTYGSLFFKYVQDHSQGHVYPISQYYDDAAAGHLPSVSFVDPQLVEKPNVENDEHPIADIQLGQKFVSDVTNALMTSPNWSSSAMFFTYDEHGGFYDHVTPPAAPVPDNIPPMLQSGDTPGAFDHYGVRVPVAVISPYAKPHYVSHVVDDHTSILRFIELRFGLPALTNRDLNADPMLDMFNFSTPSFATPPALAPAVIDPGQLAACPSS